jgi:eukaryotic-like serine/threonine-protein kinase
VYSGAVPLTPGVRLGSYEIVRPIGAGGMGEVYCARDTKLNRDVAIKMLPADDGARPDAIARFEREAHAVAALSHPNILAIHDFGTEGGVSYAVMELLDGESLRQALADGPLPPRRAVDYAIQIARGLAAAHDKGIVHRDIKPENVFITADGRVKILDFGLARQDSPLIAGATLPPTLNHPTEPGAVLGTVGYMAPEQVRGAAVDSRADIFAFGALLFEMVTGRRAFQRETAAETMTAILREDPPEDAMGGVPPAIERIVRRCLEKKPEARFRSAHDLAFALEAFSGTTSASAPNLTTTGSAVAATRRTTSRLALAVAVAAVAFAAAGGLWYGRRASMGPARGTPLEPPRFRQLTFDDVVIDAARFAPDGRTVVYGARHDMGDASLLLTRLEFPGATPLPVPNAVLFSVSPDAEMLAGVNLRRRGLDVEATLARVPLLGGAPRPLLEHVTYADWSAADGSIAAVHVVGSEQRLEFPIGHVLVSSQGEITYPRISPAGDRVAFLAWPVKTDDRGTVVVVDRTGHQETISPTWEGVRGLAWTPRGDEVWYTAASAGTQYELWASAPGRKARRIFSAPAGLLLNDIAKDGRALVAQYERGIRVEGVFDGDAAPRDLSWLSSSFAWDISNDGRKVLLTHFGQGSSQNYDVYIRGAHDAQASRVGEGQGQQVSPDGKAVLAVIHGPPSRVVIYPIGTGEAKTVPTGNVLVTNARWLADGHFMVIGTEPSRGVRAYVVDSDGAAAPRAITPERVTFSAEQIALSHDRRIVAFRPADGVMTLYHTDGSAATKANGFAADEMPIGWTGDDRSLLLLTDDSPRQLVAVDTLSGRRTVLRTIAPSNRAFIGPTSVFLTPDGRSYVANYQRRVMTLFLVDGLK